MPSPNKLTLNTEYTKLFVVLGIFLLIICGFILYAAYPLLSQKSTILATRPIDPFDVFRGQYIIIGYEISNIPTLENAEIGNSVYVILEEDSANIARYKSASLIKPDQGLFIRGKILSIYDKSMSVEYGIEQYFFERNAQFSAQNLTVKIKLSEFGGARISELLQNGEPLEMNYANITLTS